MIDRQPYDLSTPQRDYPLWQGPPSRTIVLCTHPRSGSTLLGEALYFAGGLGCPLEYFHSGFRPKFEARWQTSSFASLQRAVHEKRTAPNGTFSLKLMWHDVEEIAHELRPTRFPPPASRSSAETSPDAYREMYQLVAPILPHPVFLHLQRLDTVRQAVSSVTATQSGRWRHIPGVEDNDPLQEPEFSYDRISGMIGFAAYAHDHWAAFFTANSIQPYSLTYEGLDRDYHGTIQTLLKYLGCVATVPPVRMQRQSDILSESFVLRFLREYQAEIRVRTH